MTIPALATKWKVFRIVNYLQILGGVSMVVVIIVRTWSYSFDSPDNLFYFLLTTISFSIFAVNSLSNVYLIEKFLPDQLPSRSASRFNLVLYVIQVILCVLLILLTIFAFVETAEKRRLGDAFAIMVLLVLIILSITSSIICFLQPQLRSTIKRNYYSAFDEFLEAENP